MMHTEKTALTQLTWNWLGLLLLLGLVVTGVLLSGSQWAGYLQGFTMMFISILLEALPFVLLGALVSSLIHLHLNGETLAHLLPKNQRVGLCVAALLGFLLPVCECAIVPITRGLVRKGVPLGMAVTFLLAVPIVNPIVLASTYYAFAGAWGVVLLRAMCGFLVAIFVGDYLGSLFKNAYPMKTSHSNAERDHQHAAGCSHSHDPYSRRTGRFASIHHLLEHTSEEFFSIGRYLIMGAAFSAALQTLVPRQWLAVVGQNNLLSVIALMALAYGLSLCSEADAFIARTFVGHFTGGSILAFLVMGPMLDLKGTLLLSGAFSGAFVRRLTVTVTAAVFALGLLANGFGF